MEAIENRICTVLREEPIDWPVADGPSDVSRFLVLARYHGVVPLLNERLSTALKRLSWPAEIREACKMDTVLEAMFELARRPELSRVLRALGDADVRPLILKGAALAYSHYANPAFRHRSDTDLLILPSARPKTEEVLRSQGYARVESMTGNLISQQATWRREDSLGIVHALDVHWRINNSPILWGLFTYDELASRATPLAPLGNAARGLSPVHALLFSCIHRAGHVNALYFAEGKTYWGGDRLIWLYDMHLIIGRMSDAEHAEFVALASTKQLKKICLDALKLCVECFSTRIPMHVMTDLTPSGRAEPSARYLSGGPARQMLGDFISIRTMRDRARWLGEIAFPPSEYMHRKYANAMLRWLPLLYARRAAHGLRRLAAPHPGERNGL